MSALEHALGIGRCEWWLGEEGYCGRRAVVEHDVDVTVPRFGGAAVTVRNVELCTGHELRRSLTGRVNLSDERIERALLLVGDRRPS